MLHSLLYRLPSGRCADCTGKTGSPVFAVGSTGFLHQCDKRAETPFQPGQSVVPFPPNPQLTRSHSVNAIFSSSVIFVCIDIMCSMVKTIGCASNSCLVVVLLFKMVPFNSWMPRMGKSHGCLQTHHRCHVLLMRKKQLGHHQTGLMAPQLSPFDQCYTNVVSCRTKNGFDKPAAWIDKLSTHLPSETGTPHRKTP